MKVQLKRINDAFHFSGTGSDPVPVQIDAAESIGGTHAGARPMELLLMSLASCSAIDIILILKKQKQNPDAFEISVEGKRREDEIPAIFESIHIQYIFTGDLNENKVSRAIDLSMDTYCSVTEMLRSKVKITTSFKIN
jgi:putative redox protein